MACSARYVRKSKCFQSFHWAEAGVKLQSPSVTLTKTLTLKHPIVCLYQQICMKHPLILACFPRCDKTEAHDNGQCIDERWRLLLLWNSTRELYATLLFLLSSSHTSPPPRLHLPKVLHTTPPGVQMPPESHTGTRGFWILTVTAVSNTLSFPTVQSKVKTSQCNNILEPLQTSIVALSDADDCWLFT